MGLQLGSDNAKNADWNNAVLIACIVVVSFIVLCAAYIFISGCIQDRCRRSSTTSSPINTPSRYSTTIELGASLLDPTSVASETGCPAVQLEEQRYASVGLVHSTSFASQSNEVCCVCLNSLSNSQEDVAVTTCRHRFHYRCLREVLNRGARGETAPCPLCRTIIKWDGRDPIMCSAGDPFL